MRSNLIVIASLWLVCGCSKPEVLPIMGRYKITEQIIDGAIVKDSIPHQIADFSFMNQDSIWINNDTLAGKAYVADFFFTSCPTICPVMKKQMVRVFEKYQDESKFAIVSHSIDPKHDSIPLLNDFAKRLGVHGKNWHFLTGNQNDIYQIGEKSYLSVSGEDKGAPGGYIHSGAFILIDDQRRIRGVYDGTDVDQVDILLLEIDILLDEIKKRN